MRKSFSLLLLAWLGQGSGSLPKTDNDVISGCVERCLSIITHSLHNVYAVSDKRPDISRYLYQRMSAIEALCLIKCGLWHCVAFWTWRTVVCSRPFPTPPSFRKSDCCSLFFFCFAFIWFSHQAYREREGKEEIGPKPWKRNLKGNNTLWKMILLSLHMHVVLQTEH